MLCGGCEGEEHQKNINNALDPATEEPSQQRAGPSEAAIDPWTRSMANQAAFESPLGASKAEADELSAQRAATCSCWQLMQLMTWQALCLAPCLRLV